MDVGSAADEIAEKVHRFVGAAAREEHLAEAVAVFAFEAAVVFEPTTWAMLFGGMLAGGDRRKIGEFVLTRIFCGKPGQAVMVCAQSPASTDGDR